MQMIKVLHVGEYVQGGVATYISTLLNHPEYPDVDDYLICADKNSETNWEIPSDHIQYYPYHRSLMQIPKAMSAIRKAIKRIKPDVIYCHSTWAGLFVRFPMLFFGKTCRVIYNAHGWAFLRDTAEWKRKVYAGVERILQGQADKIINVSKYEYNAAIRYGLKKNNQTVVYSGISPEKGKVDSQVKLPLGKINLLFVGRFDPPKGLDLLLEAFNSCQRQDLHLTIIGDNVVGGGVKIEKKNTDRVTFLGWIPHDKLASYYSACDVVVMPSRWEAFGLVAIEAMKYGKAVIVSNRGALPELIEDGKNGFVFNFEKAEQLIEILERLRPEDLQVISSFNEQEFIDKYQDKFVKMGTYQLYQNR